MLVICCVFVDRYSDAETLIARGKSRAAWIVDKFLLFLLLQAFVGNTLTETVSTFFAGAA
jgi:hypothetical protein